MRPQHVLGRLTWLAGIVSALTVTDLLAGPFGMADPSFSAEGFTARCYPSSCISDGRGGLLWSFVNVVGENFSGANGIRLGGLVRTTFDGAIDTNFVVGPALQEVIGMAIQADGRILVGAGLVGDFASNGAPNYRIFRLLSNGVRDTTYHSPVFGNVPRFLTVQSDGKLLAAAQDRAGSSPANSGIIGLVRLNLDGSLDADFQPPLFTGGTAIGVFAPVVVDTNGAIYVAGGFTQVNGQSRQGIARLYPNGTLDPGFAPSGFVFSRYLRGVLLQPGGQVVIAGAMTLGPPDFTYYPLLRLNADGSVDPSFNLVSRSSIHFYLARLLKATADGKLLAVSTSMACFNSDGSLDNTFTRLPFGDASGDTSGYWECYWFELLADGRLVVPSDPSLGLGPATINGQPFNGSVCLLPDGTLDPQYSPPTFQQDIFPTTVASESSGGLLVAGNFERVGSIAKTALARLDTHGSADTNYTLGVSNVISVLALASTPSNESYALLQAGDAASGSTSNLLVRLESDGAVDPGFNLNPGPMGDEGVSLTDLLLQDGLPLVASSPSAQALLNQTNVPLARFLPDGNRDTNFQTDFAVPGSGFFADGSPITDWSVVTVDNIGELLVGDFQMLTSLPDGKILGAMGTTTSGDSYDYQLARLNADGSLDGSYTGVTLSPAAPHFSYPSVSVAGGYGQILAVYPTRCLTGTLLQSNGTMLVAGSFTNVSGTFRPGIARLGPSATLDLAFPVGAGPVTAGGSMPVRISGLSVDATGKVWVSGNFAQWDGFDAPGYIRLNQDGSIDTNCVPQSSHYALNDYDSYDTGNPLFTLFSGTLAVGSTKCYAFGPHLLPGNTWPRGLTRLVDYLPPPVFAIGMVPASGFSLGFNSESGQSYWLQTSPDLLGWQNWSNFVGTGSQLSFTDSDALFLTQRFYRVVYE